MNHYALELAVFVLGFIAGALVCFVVLSQVYKHKRVKDELLKSKRDAVRAHRALDRLLKTSLDMFSDLDAAHRQYVQFLRETTQQLDPEEEIVHTYLSAGMEKVPNYKGKDTHEDEVSDSKEKGDDVHEEEKLNISIPDELKNPEIPKMENIPSVASVVKDNEDSADENKVQEKI